MTGVPFNINDNVRVKLNDRGREIHRQQYEAISKQVNGEYQPPKVDADGWSEFQLWHVMELFGPHIHLGVVTPFDTDIEFLVKP